MNYILKETALNCFIKYTVAIVAIFAITLSLAGCGSTMSVTEKTYDSEGNLLSERTESQDVSDLSAIIGRGDGKVTSVTADVTRFSVGTDGISYFSVNGTSITAPAESASADAVLESTAVVVAASKTTITTATGDIINSSSAVVTDSSSASTVVTTATVTEDSTTVEETPVVEAEASAE